MVERALPLLLLGGCVGSLCPAGTVRGGDEGVCVDAFVGDPVPHDDVVRPLPGASWQIQLDGAVDTTVDADVFDVDLFELSDEVAAALSERVLVCYLSAGSWEDWRPDAKSFPRTAIGEPLKGWPGERWADEAALHADYRRHYVAFVERIAGQQPQARFVLMGAPDFYEDVAAVAATLDAATPGLATPLRFDGLALDACDGHPSLADDRRMAGLIEGAVDRIAPDWAEANGDAQ